MTQEIFSGLDIATIRMARAPQDGRGGTSATMVQDLVTHAQSTMDHDAAAMPAASAQAVSDALLAALTEMAALSPRRQADVAVAMRRAALAIAPEVVSATLDQLSRDGCIERPLSLSDGGVLVSVTVRGIEHLTTTTHRHVTASLTRRGLV